jgi:hypothetical protein
MQRRRRGRSKVGPISSEQHPLEAEIRAFEDRRTELEKSYLGKFVVFKDGDLVGAWDTFNAAAEYAILRFGRGPYLIRQVGAPQPQLPASVLYRRAAQEHADL